ncbi:hypothetical protein HMPREF9081_0013 [Centipeda periodontii DSM 2778]|uniref:Uncharacterized protein n=1 Tax=Centipeda periodontii DSM 2778 TaxID=888060 RepID=F5RIC8_9FIRM|nr:hypothetical protein HMPREF9081_0013 [Centipeda periodontii DSM 2778]
MGLTGKPDQPHLFIRLASAIAATAATSLISAFVTCRGCAVAVVAIPRVVAVAVRRVLTLRQFAYPAFAAIGEYLCAGGEDESRKEPCNHLFHNNSSQLQYTSYLYSIISVKL